MKKRYIDPELEIVQFSTEDILTASNETGEGEVEWGTDYPDIP